MVTLPAAQAAGPAAQIPLGLIPLGPIPLAEGADPFTAGRRLREGDPFALFWQQEAARLDWVQHFLADLPLAALLLGLRTREEDEDEDEEEEEIEEHYSKADLAKIGTGSLDSYTYTG